MKVTMTENHRTQHEGIYAIQIGREKELCYWEVCSLAVLHGFSIISQHKNLVFIRPTGSDFSPTTIVNDAGGIIRLLKVLTVGESDLTAVVEEDIAQRSGKWAVSGIDNSMDKLRQSIRQSIRRAAGTGQFPQLGAEVRVAPGANEVVPARMSEVLAKTQINEYYLFRDADHQIQVGLTQAVAPFQKFEERDIKKPFRPRQRGLLPPKLARTMINLARQTGAGKLLDPFCGSGVVLLEGLDLGMEVYGSDNRDEAIAQTKANLDWMLGQHQTRGVVNLLKRIDVRQLEVEIPALSIDMVVAEGDLGPPIRGKLPRKQSVHYASTLKNLYVQAFAQIRTVLRPGGRVVLALPEWYPNEGDPIRIEMENELGMIGYQPAFPQLGMTPVVYHRHDQRVGRAIYILESPH